MDIRRFKGITILLLLGMLGASSVAQTHSSGSLIQVVNQATPGSGGIAPVAVTSSLNPSAYNQTVVFTASTPADATGTVTFYDGATALGTGSVSSGTATYSTATLSVGSHSITASYSGDVNYTAATSAAITQAVNKADSLTQLFLSSPTAPLGTPVTFTALISTGGVAPSSTSAVFYDGSTNVGTGAVAVVNTTNLALYSENLNGSAWQTNQASVDPSTVPGPTPTSTGTSFTSSGANGYVQQSISGLPSSSPVTFSAWLQVASGTQSVPLSVATLGGTNLGTNSCSVSTTWARCAVTVTTQAGQTSGTFTIGGVATGIQIEVWGVQVEAASSVGPYIPTASASASGSGGTASLTLSNLDAGAHSMTASYPGDANINPSSSTASATDTLTVTKVNGASLSVTSSANPSIYNQSVTFTITVAGVAGITPTGTVTLMDGAAQIGTATLNNGSATVSTSSLTAGTHPIAAQYGGDSNYNAGASPVLDQVVNKATPAPGSVSVSTSTSPTVFGQSVTFTATVPGDGTGTVTFLDGANTIGTGAVSNGTATFTTASLGVGSHSITVSWGDSNYVTTTSAPITQVVNKTGVTVVITSSENPSTYGDTVTFTATVTGVNGVVPTGTLQFADGGVSLGTAVTIDATGKATLTDSALTAGSHTITATYSGDSNYY